MKHYLRKLLIVFMSLYVAYSLVPTINLGNDPKNWLVVVISFFLVTVIIKPIFSLILIPINFLTIGLVSFLLNTATIFALTMFISGLSVSAYNFPGANLGGIILQPVALSQVATVFALGLLITVTQKVLHFIFE